MKLRMMLYNHVIVILVTLCLMTGCSSTSLNEETQKTTDKIADQHESTIDKASTLTETIKVYAVDPQGISIVEHFAEITYSINNPVGKLKLVMAQLQADSVDSISLWKDVQLVDVSYSEGLVTLNFHFPTNYTLEPSREAMMIEALQKTLFQFPEIQKIETLVDGEKTDYLYKTVQVLHPMTRPY